MPTCSLCSVVLSKRPVSDIDCIPLIQDLIKWKHVSQHALPRKVHKMSASEIRNTVLEVSDSLIGLRASCDDTLSLDLNSEMDFTMSDLSECDDLSE
jgi:hypothetical protein